MRKGDKSFCTYRGHAHTLARGASMEGVLGELMLRDNGLMRGKGGSMHLTSVEHDVLGFFDFIRAAIEGREFSKFVFTRSLSDALSLFKELGAQHGFSPEECSFANINCIKELYGSSNDVRSILANSIAKGKTDYRVASQLRLPSVPELCPKP